MKVLSIVVPVYNEEESVNMFHASLVTSLEQVDYQTEIVYVDDGSTDSTHSILKNFASVSENVVIVSLSRNFGHQAALSAGLSYSSGEVVVTLDGDGQHHPRYIPKMLSLYETGYDIVHMQRVNQTRSFVKNITARFFYQLINKIGGVSIVEGVADFRLMSRQVVDCLNQMPEYHRFLRGLVSWMGFSVFVLPYEMELRTAGKPKYTLARSWQLAQDAIFSFSTISLRLALLSSIFIFFLMLLHLGYVLWVIFTQGIATLAPGWTTLMLSQLLIGFIQLLMLGFQGYYIGMIFQEIKSRPIYIVREYYKSKQVDSSPE